jgi:hypothetical protein
MKRTNLVLNEDNLETATKLMGARTYSEAVNRALEQAIQLIKIRNLAGLTGSNIWEGNLGEMRKDRPKKSKGRS